MTLDTRARESLHRLFLKECDGVRDALLAASAISYALEMDGPAMLAADRIRLARALGPTRFVEECRAFTIAKHARTWVSFMQMFGSNEDVDREMTEYLRDFVPNLVGLLDSMGTGRFSPTPGNDDVFAWGAALEILGTIWVEGNKQGIATSDLWDRLWKVN